MSSEKIKNMENLVIEMERLDSEQEKIDEVIENINTEKNNYDSLISERDDE
jgi:predicted nuclease with TOPRIM domain